MALIKGITVTLIKRAKTGTDVFGADVFTETEVDVENVLVAPAASDDVIKIYDRFGKRIVYTLAIPKGDTNSWEDTKVKFFDHTFKTVGYPEQGIDDLIPLDWNKKVQVELYG